MATTEITVDAPRSEVFRSLLDAWTYEVWVGGAKRIRDVDTAWPEPGSCFHHSVGLGPLMTRDETKMLRYEPDKLVELEMHLWPIGEGVVRIELKERGPRTHVTMYENFKKGPAAWADNKLQQQLMKVRNDFSLDKLKRIVEQRHGMRQRGF